MNVLSDILPLPFFAGVRRELDGSITTFSISTAEFYKAAGYTKNRLWRETMAEKHEEQAKWESQLPDKSVARMAALEHLVAYESKGLKKSLNHYCRYLFRARVLQVSLPVLTSCAC